MSHLFKLIPEYRGMLSVAIHKALAEGFMSTPGVQSREAIAGYFTQLSPQDSDRFDGIIAQHLDVGELHVKARIVATLSEYIDEVLEKHAGRVWDPAQHKAVSLAEVLAEQEAQALEADDTHDGDGSHPDGGEDDDDKDLYSGPHQGMQVTSVIQKLTALWATFGDLTVTGGHFGAPGLTEVTLIDISGYECSLEDAIQRRALDPNYHLAIYLD